VAVVVLAVTAAAAVVDLAVAAVVVALAAVAAMAAAAVRSAVDQPRLKASLAIGPSMVGNGPIIELHLGAPQFAVLGYPAPHSDAPHLERTGCEFGSHDFDHAGFCDAGSFEDRFKRGSIFPSHLNDRRNIAGAQGCGRFKRFGHAAFDSSFNVDLTRDIIKLTGTGLQVQVKIAP
jgi:hypothetical protein